MRHGLTSAVKSPRIEVLPHQPLGRPRVLDREPQADSTGRPMDEKCGDCTVCVDACPVKAFTGRVFRADEPREARFDPVKCARFRGSDLRYQTTQDKLGNQDKMKREVYACGVCVKVCPYGKPDPR